MKLIPTHTNTSLLLSPIAAVGILSGSAQAALIHHWEFDEGTGLIAADSVGSENGDIIGATWSSDATRSSFLSFDGTNDYVNPTLVLPLMTTTNDFSWAVWVNAQETIKTGSIIIGNRRDSAGGNPSPLEFTKLTPTAFEWRPNNTPTNADTTDLPANTWVHLAVVKDGDTIQTYYNGVADASVTFTEDFVNTTPFFIGGDNGGRGIEYFRGFIDDVRIYNSALTPTEVASLIPEPSTSLLGALAFGCLFVRRKR